jgi:WD40 repeat protein
MGVLAVGEKLASADRWDLWRGTLWPSGVPAVGLYLRAEARMDRVLPAHGVVVSPKGAVLTLGEAPYLFPGARRDPVPLTVPVDGASFSPDGASIFAVGGGARVLLDAADGKVLRRRELDEPGSAAVVAWRGDTLLVGEEGDYQVVRAGDLGTVIEHATGPLSPTGEWIVQAAAPPDWASTSPPGEALRVLDTRTGAVLHRERGEPPGFSRWGGREVHWSPDGRRLSWFSRALHVLDVGRRRTTVVPSVSLGEGDAESAFVAGPTPDGARVCFAQDSKDATYDVARRAVLRDRPGRAFRCLVADGTGYVVEIPLLPHEQVVDLPAEGFGTWPDFVFSRDRTLAAVLVTDARIPDADARPLSLLVIDVGARELTRRVPLGVIAPGGGRPRLVAVEGADAVDVELTSEDPQGGAWRVALATGARSRVPTEPPPIAAPAPADPPFAVTHARVEVRGAGVLWNGPEGVVAYRLDRRSEPVRWPAGNCEHQISPRGRWLFRLCASGGHRGFEGGEVASLLGDPPRPVPPQIGLESFAVADDGGTVMAIGWSALEISVQGVSRRIVPRHGDGSFSSVAWSPDGTLVAAWHPGARTTYLLERGRDTPRWSRPALEDFQVSALRFSDDGKLVILGPQRALSSADGSDAVVPAPPAAAVREPLDRDRKDGGELLAGGSVVATASSDGLVRLHEVASGATIATLIPLKQGSAVAIFADGRVDWLGETVAAPDVLCLRGTTVVPADRCAPLLDREALARTAGPD